MSWLSTLFDQWRNIGVLATVITALAGDMRFFMPRLRKHKIRFALAVIGCFIVLSIAAYYVLPYFPDQKTAPSSIQTRTNTAITPSVTPAPPPVTTQTQPPATPSDPSQLSPVETVEQPVTRPPSDAIIHCGGLRAVPKYWSANSTGGYRGLDSGGYQCPGGSYIQVPTTQTTIFFSNTRVAQSIHSVDIWVYIPATNATAVVTYDLEFHTLSGLRKSEPWLIDQSRFSGWLYLGTAPIPPDTITFTLVLSSDDSNAHHFLAEDSAAMLMHA